MLLEVVEDGWNSDVRPGDQLMLLPASCSDGVDDCERKDEDEGEGVTEENAKWVDDEAEEGYGDADSVEDGLYESGRSANWWPGTRS